MTAVEGEEDAVGEDPVALGRYKMDIMILSAPLGECPTQGCTVFFLGYLNFV